MMENENEICNQKRSKLFVARLLIVHILYFLYSSFLWVGLWRVAGARQFEKHATFAALITWFCIYIAFNIYLMVAALWDKITPECFKKPWIHVPTFIVILFNGPPYMFTIRYYYMLAEEAHISDPAYANCTIGNVYEDIPAKEFIFFHLVSPLILLTFILYPRYGKSFALNDYLGLALELINIFDIMELTDDIQYINNYEIFWLILYFISTLIGILLISYPVEIDSDDLNWENYRKNSYMSCAACCRYCGNVSYRTETGKETLVSNEPSTDYGSFEKGENITDRTKAETGALLATSISYCKFDKIWKFDLKNETDRVHFRKFLKALLTLIFVDICFATIRLKVMLTEQSVELGFNMVVKNIILAFLHSSYLLNLFWLRGRQQVSIKAKPFDSARNNGNGHKKKYFTPHKRNKQTKKEELLLS